jgi:hypothetical protein
MVIAAAFVFTYGAVGHLRARSAAAEPLAGHGAGTGLA